MLQLIIHWYGFTKSKWKRCINKSLTFKRSNFFAEMGNVSLVRFSQKAENLYVLPKIRSSQCRLMHLRVKSATYTTRFIGGFMCFILHFFFTFVIDFSFHIVFAIFHRSLCQCCLFSVLQIYLLNQHDLLARSDFNDVYWFRVLTCYASLWRSRLSVCLC